MVYIIITDMLHTIVYVNYRYGPHYWLMDVQMNCTETIDGWFELKTFLTNYTPNSGWEVDINQTTSCEGTAGGTKPYVSNNHLARCGFVNVFEFDLGSCEINTFESMFVWDPPSLTMLS